jgi:AhpD family alkylhydroperoxidase
VADVLNDAASACRVPLVVADQPGLAELEERILRERGRVSVFYRALLNSVPVAGGWERLLTAVRKETLLPARTREMLILRVAHLTGCAFEIRAHEVIAAAEGVPAAKLAALGRRELEAAAFDPSELQLLRLADLMTCEVQVPENLVADARQVWGPRMLVEIIVTIAAYNMVARTVEALGIA